MYIPNVYRNAVQCTYFLMSICYPMYIYLSPNVYSIYIGYIHWVASEYTLGCKTYTLCCIFCHTMYIQKNVTQCIYVKMHYNVYPQCYPMYIKCNTMYMAPYTFRDGHKEGYSYTLGCILYTFGCILIYIAGVD